MICNNEENVFIHFILTKQYCLKAPKETKRQQLCNVYENLTLTQNWKFVLVYCFIPIDSLI